MTSNHPSNLVLDEIAAGFPVDETLLVHTRDCARCSERLAHIQTARRQFQASADFRAPLDGLRPAATRRAARRWSLAHLLAGAGVLAAAAVVLVSVRPTTPYNGVKGEASIGWVRGPDGEPVTGSVRPGDQLALFVVPAGAHDVLVMAVGEDGSVSQLWPQDRDGSGPAPRGGEKLSPPFLVTPGSAMLFAFFSDEPLMRGSTEQSLKQAIEDAHRHGRAPTAAVPPPLPGERARATKQLCVEGSPCSPLH